ncbi:radical SAM protein [bacterium]|nr:radical SAM protein [bacterium]
MIFSAFEDPYLTAKGEIRAKVSLEALKTLWLNTGTLCNLHCENCYIESSPRNDRLSYLTVEDIVPFLDEIKAKSLPTKMIGLTGGEPFINPQIMELLEECLSRGFDVLVLSNAYKVIRKHEGKLLALQQLYKNKLFIRVSLDHFTQDGHEAERGPKTFELTMQRLQWFFEHGFEVSVAGRALKAEPMTESKAGYAKLLKDYAIDLDINSKLVIFPEMEMAKNVPEITTACWDILGVKPQDQMCAHERMLVKRKGESKPVVMPCTLLAYQDDFVLGKTLEDAQQDVPLNHPFCAQFCVLGGSSCSATK